MSTPLEHEWETVSRHRTSEGTVRYRRCRCGVWRIEPGGDLPPAVVVPDQTRRSSRTTTVVSTSHNTAATP